MRDYSRLDSLRSNDAGSLGCELFLYMRASRLRWLAPLILNKPPHCTRGLIFLLDGAALINYPRAGAMRFPSALPRAGSLGMLKAAAVRQKAIEHSRTGEQQAFKNDCGRTVKAGGCSPCTRQLNLLFHSRSTGRWKNDDANCLGTTLSRINFFKKYLLHA